MSDLKNRFRSLDELSTPNLWHEIEERAMVSQPMTHHVSWVLITVTLLLALAFGSAALIGSGIVKLPALPVLPDGPPKHLAYGLDGDIFVADWDGTNPVRIADGVLDPGGAGPGACGSFWGEGPMWSPDGRYVAYRSAWDASCRGTTGEGHVNLSDAVGHIVASFPGAGWLVSWSPDSSRVATWVDGADLGKTIGIYGLDGARQALLTVPPGCALPGDFDPVWSPDGGSLVIWPCEVPLDGSTPRPFPGNDPRSHDRWAYSPDGARVAYVVYTEATQSTSWHASLVVAAADGSQDRVLVPTGVTSGGVWSPTGDRIAFDAGPSLSPADEIRIIDVASGKLTSLVTARGTSSLHVIRFSPDGDRILFARLDANSVGTSLWSVRTDGSDARLLVTGTGWGDWQPLPAGS